MKKINKWLSDNLAWLVVLAVAALCATFILCGSKSENGYITLDGKDATIEEYTDEFIKESNELLKGLYTQQDNGSSEEQTPQMGASPYYKVDISTPDAFYYAVNGKSFDEGWGKQCVAGFKEFQFSLAGRIVNTSTGGASGYAGQQAQIEPLGFKWHAGSAGLQNGDWGIFGGGRYGHVAMYYNGKWFGQNQGAADSNVGTPFNLMAIGTTNLLGYYRPNIYTQQPAPQPSPEPSPTPSPVTGDITHVVKRGDTLGGILVAYGFSGRKLFGDDGLAQKVAEYNGIPNRGLIYPGQVITIKREW